MKEQSFTPKHILLKRKQWNELLNVIHYSRAYQWHPGKLPVFIGITITLVFINHHQISLPWIIGAYVLTCLYLAAGYMLNNLSDASYDFVAGKSIGLEHWKANSVILLVVGVVGIGMVSTLLLSPAKTVPWILLSYGLAYVYSYPPRLKEHVFWGPFIAALTQIPAPAIAVVIYCDNVSPLSILYMVVSFFFGLRMIFVHHLLDYKNDILTGISTTATSFGKRKIYFILYLFFGVETILTCILIFALFKTVIPAFLLIFFTIPLFVAIKRFIINNQTFRLDNYEFIPLSDIHESVLPLILSLALAIKLQGEMLLLPPILILIFSKRLYERLILPFKKIY